MFRLSFTKRPTVHNISISVYTCIANLLNLNWLLSSRVTNWCMWWLLYVCRETCGYSWSWWTAVWTSSTSWSTRSWSWPSQRPWLAKWQKLWVTTSLCSLTVASFPRLFPLMLALIHDLWPVYGVQRSYNTTHSRADLGERSLALAGLFLVAWPTAVYSSCSPLPADCEGSPFPEGQS